MAITRIDKSGSPEDTMFARCACEVDACIARAYPLTHKEHYSVVQFHRHSSDASLWQADEAAGVGLAGGEQRRRRDGDMLAADDCEASAAASDPEEAAPTAYWDGGDKLFRTLAAAERYTYIARTQRRAREAALSLYMQQHDAPVTPDVDDIFRATLDGAAVPLGDSAYCAASARVTWGTDPTVRAEIAAHAASVVQAAVRAAVLSDVSMAREYVALMQGGSAADPHFANKVGKYRQVLARVGGRLHRAPAYAPVPDDVRDALTP